MDLKEIEALIPADWLKQHWDEYVALCEKHMMTIILTKAFERRYSKPLKTPEELHDFFAFEAEQMGIETEKVKAFLTDAGKLKAAATIFDIHFKKRLPQDQNGNCLVPVPKIRKFIDQTFQKTSDQSS